KRSRGEQVLIGGPGVISADGRVLNRDALARLARARRPNPRLQFHRLPPCPGGRLGRWPRLGCLLGRRRQCRLVRPANSARRSPDWPRSNGARDCWNFGFAPSLGANVSPALVPIQTPPATAWLDRRSTRPVRLAQR